MYDTYIYICICIIHMCVYIYIYIYIHLRASLRHAPGRKHQRAHELRQTTIIGHSFINDNNWDTANKRQ